MNCKTCNVLSAPWDLIEGLCHPCTARALAECSCQLEERANERDAALAACAAMREALRTHVELTRSTNATDAALSLTAGKGWLSPEEAEKLRGEVEKAWHEGLAVGMARPTETRLEWGRSHAKLVAEGGAQ